MGPEFFCIICKLIYLLLVESPVRVWPLLWRRRGKNRQTLECLSKLEPMDRILNAAHRLHHVVGKVGQKVPVQAHAQHLIRVDGELGAQRHEELVKLTLVDATVVGGDLSPK